jgi:hypothetical protein
MNFRVSFEPGLHRFGLMGREVIQNDVNLFFAPSGNHAGEKLTKLSRAVTFAAAAHHLAGGYFQSGIERASAVTDIFKTAPFDAPGAQA